MDLAPHDAERRTRAVALLTLATMGVEVAAGLWFNSMALLADGWHMGTHAAAIGLSALAYALARRWRHDRRFVFGPWKLEMLAAFTSALALLAAAAGIAWASVQRLWMPSPIQYEQAMAVAVLGLAVNLLSAWWLRDRPHGHGHGHDHGPAHQDLNLRAAYLHVLADALTSALAIVALALGLWLGWAVLDPLIGLVGAGLVAHWGLGLARDTARVLLDAEGEQMQCNALRERVRQGLESALPEPHRLRVVELRLWRIDGRHWAVVLRVATDSERVTAQTLRQMLQRWPELQVLAVEVAAPCSPVPTRA